MRPCWCLTCVCVRGTTISENICFPCRKGVHFEERKKRWEDIDSLWEESFTGLLGGRGYEDELC